MRVLSLSLRDFRSYASAEATLGPALTVVTGRNGAGKSNLLEGLCVGCTGRSFRSTSDREIVRFDAPAARVEIVAQGDGGRHVIGVGLAPSAARRLTVDGASVPSLAGVETRPLVAVFSPDRLELLTGRPALRRGHLDQLVAGMWPARAAARTAYARVLAQRNALLTRLRAGSGSTASLTAWDGELARHGVALRDTRAAAVEAVAAASAELATDLGLDAGLEVRYLPRTRAVDAEGFSAELAERRASDLERGFSQHGPHRDELSLRLGGREVKTYASQGQRRLALLALLLAEREALAARRDQVPLLLLDDVMSELDADRRRLLVERLQRTGGQSVIATTDLAHVPGGDGADVTRLAVTAGTVLAEAVAA